MDIRPLHDRLIVRRLEEGEQKVGGIIIPDSAKEKPQHGKVIAAGDGKINDEGKRFPLDVKAGDRDPLRQVHEPGDQARWRGVPDHARRRSAGRHRRRRERRRSSDRQDASRSAAGDRGYGKTDYLRRCLAAGDSSRRQQPGQRGQGDARAEGAQRHPRQEIRLADDHQGRRDRREGNRPAGSAREHGRADGARKSPARRRMWPATAPRPRRCWRRPSIAKARRTSPPAPTRWRSSAASTRPSRPSSRR